MLPVTRIEPFVLHFATLLLSITSYLSNKFRGEGTFGWPHFHELIRDAGKTIVNIVGIHVGIGTIIGALSLTGVGPAFSSELHLFADGHTYELLILDAITSFVLGMGMTVTACYIFRAALIGSALIESGLSAVA